MFRPLGMLALRTLRIYWRITKPVTFDGLVRVVRALQQYWFEIVELPPLDGGGVHGDR